jgi:hypothetical protein
MSLAGIQIIRRGLDSRQKHAGMTKRFLGIEIREARRAGDVNRFRVGCVSTEGIAGYFLEQRGKEEDRWTGLDHIFPENRKKLRMRSERAFQTARVFFGVLAGSGLLGSGFPIPCLKTPLCR